MVKNPPDSINDLFDEITDEIMEVVLDDDAEKFLQPYQAMLPKSSSKEAPATYVSKPWHQKKLTYLKLLSHGGLFVPSRQLADFVCGCFAILDFLENETVLLGMSVAKVAT